MSNCMINSNYMETLRVIDLVLPCYNPSPGWHRKVVECLDNLYRRCSSVRFRVFVVSDGSVRGFEDRIRLYLYENIKDLKIIMCDTNKGKGEALRTAIAFCSSEYIIYTDYDFPYTEDSFCEVLTVLFSQKPDIIVATRSEAYQKNLPPFRRFLSKSSHLCNKWILNLDIADTQGGLKAFSSRGKEVFLQTKVKGFLFDTEFIYKATKRNLRIKSVQATIRDDIRVSNFGFQVLKREFINFVTIMQQR